MLLDRNLIEISKSPWSSRLLFVEKAPEDRKILDNDGIPGQKLEGKPAKLRLVVDFRNVNSKLKQLNSNWPAPTIKDILNELHEAAYLSTLDVTQGFFSYPITESSKQYTAFTYGDTVLQFRRLPQGLSISSKIMQFKMKSFQFKHQLKGVTVYIDNILLFGPTKEIYEQRLEAFFKACVSEGIKLKPNKCHHYIHKKFIIFGFEVDLEKHTIAPEEAKVKKIRQLIAPNTKKKCKGFLGAVGYFSDMLPNLQKDLSPLNAICGQNSRFIWNNDCQKAFDKVKVDLTKLPLIYILRPDKQIYVSTDACISMSISYSLWQKDDIDNKLYPIKHNSHKLSAGEKTLSQFESEALATIYCINKEQALLSFGNMVLYTDARGLSSKGFPVALYVLIFCLYNISNICCCTTTWATLSNCEIRDG